jgi:hypothetical protein
MRAPVIHEVEAGHGRAAQLGGATQDRLEHGLRILDRVGNHFQDFRGRRLPLERLVRLAEKPRVLDRDHRLVGEALHDPQFLVGERLAERATPTTPMPLPSQIIGAKATE